MKKLSLFIAILCVSHFAQAQQDKTTTFEAQEKTLESPPPPPNNKDDRVFTFVEQKPEFPGGEKALMQFLGDNIKYPKDAQKEKVEGKVFTSFLVERDGSVTNIKILRGIFASCDAEVVRVLNDMPKWRPGRQNGQNVKVQYTLPISFTLDKEVVSIPYNIKNPIINPEAPEEDQIRTFVEQKPEFIAGGDEVLKNYLKENTKLPDAAKAANISGKVFMQFVVEKDGSVSNIKVLRGPDYGCHEEAVRVIKTMPLWIPARHKRVKVRCLYTLPVPFGVAE